MSEVSQLRILVVDDDELDRMAVRRALGSAGIQAIFQEAGDGKEALEALLQATFDCIFLDVRMPDRDGLSVLKAVRALGVKTPIIMLTGFGDEATAVELMKAGAADYFSKAQLLPDRLAQSLQQALRVHVAEQEAARLNVELTRYAGQLSELSQAAVALRADDSSAAIGALLADRARRLLGRQVGGVILTEGPPQHFRDEGAGAVELLPPSREALDGALRSGRLAGQGEDLLPSPMTGRRGQLVGALYVTAPPGERLSERDRSVLLQLAQLGSAAVENAALYHALERASRARDDMVAMVSHDLRNPLNVVLMSSSMLGQLNPSEPGSSKRSAALVERLQRASKQMITLVNDLLDASRIEAGALQIQAGVQPAHELIDEALESFRPLAAEKGVELSAEHSPVLPDVTADRARVFQVFSNLLGNAIKFTPAGGIIRLSAAEEMGAVKYSVSDTGPGIAAADVGRIFDRYWQPRESSASHLGAGLGLFIAKGIVDAHRGRIAVDTVPGQGCTFWFTLPVAGSAPRRFG